MSYPDTQLFIAGRWQEVAGGGTLPVINLASDKEIGRVSRAGKTDLDRAAKAAQEGLPSRSLSNVLVLSHRVGMLWINQSFAPWQEMPFGGVKDLGYGSEGGPEALDVYLNTRSVSIHSD